MQWRKVLSVRSLWHNKTHSDKQSLPLKHFVESKMGCIFLEYVWEEMISIWNAEVLSTIVEKDSSRHAWEDGGKKHLRLLHSIWSALRKWSWAGEVAQQLRSLATLAEDLGLIPSTYWVAQQHSLTPVPGDLITASSLHGHQAWMHAQTFV